MSETEQKMKRDGPGCRRMTLISLLQVGKDTSPKTRENGGITEEENGRRDSHQVEKKREKSHKDRWGMGKGVRKYSTSCTLSGPKEGNQTNTVSPKKEAVEVGG